MKWPDHDEPPACSRLHNWLSNQDARAGVVHSRPAEQVESLLRAAALGFQSARRPLIWLESVDVSAARAAVRLAQQAVLRCTSRSLPVLS